MLGHADRMGLRDDDASKSWNSSHPSRACDAPSLVATGGAGLLYCFAARTDLNRLDAVDESVACRPAHDADPHGRGGCGNDPLPQRHLAADTAATATRQGAATPSPSRRACRSPASSTVRPATAPIPAVVLLHPCSGRLPTGHRAGRCRALHRARLRACWRVDSFTARGIADGGCTGGGASVDGVMDAYGALHASRQPAVHRSRAHRHRRLRVRRERGAVRRRVRRARAAVRSPVRRRGRLLSLLPREDRRVGADPDPGRCARRMGAGQRLPAA